MQQFDQAPIMKNLHDGIAIVIDGNKAKVAADEGQYILLKNSTITGKEDGGYTAAKDIPADTVLDGTYLSSKLSEGIANSLNDQITNVKDDYTYTLASGYSLESWGAVKIMSFGRLIYVRATGLKCSRTPGGTNDTAITISGVSTLKNVTFQGAGTTNTNTAGEMRPIVPMLLSDGTVSLGGVYFSGKTMSLEIIGFLA